MGDFFGDNLVPTEPPAERVGGDIRSEGDVVNAVDVHKVDEVSEVLLVVCQLVRRCGSG